MSAFAFVAEDIDSLDDVPDTSDPRWVAWSAPLLAQLSEPRDLFWLQAWAESVCGWPIAREYLAWLSFNDKAKVVFFNNALCWVRSAEPDKEIPKKKYIANVKKLDLTTVQRISKEEILKQCDAWDGTVLFSTLLLSTKEILNLPYTRLAEKLETFGTSLHVWVNGIYKPRNDILLRMLPRIKNALLSM